MPRQAARHTLYDVLDQKGYFDSNPANLGSVASDGSSLYEKQDFPRMLYHPEGERRVTVPAEVVLTPFGPKEYGEQTEIISQLARNAGEMKRLRDAGWHLLPADAMKAAGEVVPATTAEAQEVQNMAAHMAEMRAKMAEMAAALAAKDEAPQAAFGLPKPGPSKGPLLA